MNGLSFEVRAGRDPRHRRGPGQRADRAVRGADGAAAHGRAARSRWTAATSPAPRPASGCAPGMAYVPEDRQEDGLVGDFSVADNIVLDTYDQPPFASGINLQPAARSPADATELVEEFDVRTSSAATPVGTLSGGNQQKVILARELGREHKVLVASQPTRGLDVGLDRVRAPPDRRAARPRRGGAHRLVRARRDLRARRPDRGHVRGQDHRLPAAGRAGRRTRAADGRRRRRGPATARARSRRPRTRDPVPQRQRREHRPT